MTREVPWARLGLAGSVGAWLDAAPDLVAVLDRDLRLVYSNQAFEAATGRGFGQDAGRPIGALAPFGTASAALLTLLGEARERPGTPAEAELTWQPDGSTSQQHLRVRAVLEHGVSDAGPLLVMHARDVSQFRETERSLRAREAEFRTLAENTPDNIIRYDLDGYATYCNQAFGERVNVSAASMLGKRPTEAAPPDMIGAQEYERAVLDALRTGAPGRVEVSVRRPDGTTATHSVLIRAERADTGSITGAIAIGRDVTDLAQARQSASERERAFRTLAENAADQIARWDTHGRFVYANPPMLAVLGLPADETYGRTIAQIGGDRYDAAAAAVERVRAGGAAELVEQHLVDRRDGREHVHQVRCVPEHGEDGTLISVLGVSRDITAEVRHREELERLASTDLLTGLPNSQALYHHAPQLLQAARAAGTKAAVLLLDLDGFKSVNDTLGHAGGDQVLRAVAEQVRSRVSSHDLVARMGGDEFVIVVADLSSTGDPGVLGERVQTALAELGADLAVPSSASIGVAVFPEDGDTIDALVSNADMAMYQAKRTGPGRIDYFRPELSAALQRRSAVLRALEEPGLFAQLQLHLQPVFALNDDNTLAGAEALLRWTHPELGWVPPEEFIPLAEESGAIIRIGRWVLSEAAAVASRVNRHVGLPGGLRIAVNVSTRQFLNDDVGAAFAEALSDTSCAAGWLAAEITETLLLEDSHAVHVALAHLRGLGVPVAIDDFGTGYSALHYLTRFPLDMLKIDRRFIHGLGTGTEHDELVRALVAMARALGLTVIAEGIETAGQLAFLRAQGCDLGQGFLLGRPEPATAFEARAARRIAASI